MIGREGQNVRLASKLTEYNIEVKGEEAPVTEDTPLRQGSAGQAEKPTEETETEQNQTVVTSKTKKTDPVADENVKSE